MILTRGTTYLFGIILAATLVGSGLYLYRHPDKIKPMNAASAPDPLAPPPNTPPNIQAQSGSGPTISDASRIELLNAFMKALAYSNDQQRRMVALCEKDNQCKGGVGMTQRAVDDYNRIAKGVVGREKLPEGTGFNVDAGTGRVNVVVPAQSSARTKTVP